MNVMIFIVTSSGAIGVLNFTCMNVCAFVQEVSVRYLLVPIASLRAGSVRDIVL